MEPSNQFRVYCRKDLTAYGLGSRSTIDRRIADGTFPKPKRLGGRDIWTHGQMQKLLKLLGETS